MAAKYMRIKEIVIPFLTLVILLSQLSGCAVLSPSEVVEESQKGEEVVIEYADKDQSKNNESDDLTQAISNVKQSETLAPMTNDELISLFDRAYQFSIKEGWPEVFGDYLNCELNLILKYSMDDGKELPADYKERYIDWRPLDGADAKSDQSLFYQNDLTLYAVEVVNLREHYSTDSNKVGSLAVGDSVHCIGIGIEGTDAEGWCKIQLSDGRIVYVSSDYLMSSKPATSNSTKANSENKGTSSGGNQNGSSGGTSSSGSNTGSSNPSIDALDSIIPDGNTDPPGWKPSNDTADPSLGKAGEKGKYDIYG